MQLEIQAFGIIRDIAQGDVLTIEVKDAATVAELKAALFAQYEALAKLQSLAIAVNATYQTDDYVIDPKDEVVIIPPVSGG